MELFITIMHIHIAHIQAGGRRQAHFRGTPVVFVVGLVCILYAESDGREVKYTVRCQTHAYRSPSRPRLRIRGRQSQSPSCHALSAFSSIPVKIPLPIPVESLFAFVTIILYPSFIPLASPPSFLIVPLPLSRCVIVTPLSLLIMITRYDSMTS